MLKQQGKLRRCPHCGGTKLDSTHDRWTCRYCKMPVSKERWTFLGAAGLTILVAAVLYFVVLVAWTPRDSAVVWFPVVYFSVLAGILTVLKSMMR